MTAETSSGMRECDVLVIGGGPAGTTAAAMLAKKGRDVVLLERDQHPRFHIGESLLPKNLPIFAELGVLEQVQAIGVYKPGAEFISERCGRRVGFPFCMGINGNGSHAYQVPRADLDKLLFETAAAQGVETHENARVVEVIDATPDQRASVRAVHADGERHYAPRFVLDASGRAGVMATRNGTRQSDKNNNSAAVFAHFRGVPASAPDREGYISVHLAEDGWFWTIPLPGDVTSVGFVGTQKAFKSRSAGPDTMLMQRIESSPVLRDRMKDAQIISAIHTEANYSYQASAAWGEGWFLAGDAFAFLDPVFSSGVLLAMDSAKAAADVADRWLGSRADGMRSARAAEKRIRQQMRGISWLIYRINHPVLRSMFMSPSNVFRMRDGLISILAGDLKPGLKASLPSMAFKGVFYLLSAAHRMGLRLEPSRS